jgi:hypothetical protein
MKKYTEEDLKKAFEAGQRQTYKKDYANENEYGIPEYTVFVYKDFEDYLLYLNKK